MIQGWSTFDESQNLIEIEDYSNFGDADDNPYEKVLLAVNGSIPFSNFRYWLNQTARQERVL